MNQGLGVQCLPGHKAIQPEREPGGPSLSSGASPLGHITRPGIIRVRDLNSLHRSQPAWASRQILRNPEEATDRGIYLGLGRVGRTEAQLLLSFLGLSATAGETEALSGSSPQWTQE